MSLPSEEQLARRVGRSRRSVKTSPGPTELDRLERTVLMHQQGMDAGEARAALKRMLRRAA